MGEKAKKTKSKKGRSLSVINHQSVLFRCRSHAAARWNFFFITAVIEFRIVEGTMWTRCTNGRTADAGPIMSGAFLSRIIAVRLFLAFVWMFGQKCSFGRTNGCWSWFAATIGYVVMNIADAHVLVEKRLVRTQTTNTTEIGARIIGVAAFLLWIREIAIGILAAVDGQFLGRFRFCRRCSWQWRRRFLSGTHEQIDPSIAEIVLRIEEQSFGTFELVGGTGNASIIDRRAFIVVRRVRTIGFVLAIVFGRQQRSLNRFWSWCNRGRWFRASDAGENLFVEIA